MATQYTYILYISGVKVYDVHKFMGTMIDYQFYMVDKWGRKVIQHLF